MTSASESNVLKKTGCSQVIKEIVIFLLVKLSTSLS